MHRVPTIIPKDESHRHNKRSPEEAPPAPRGRYRFRARALNRCNRPQSSTSAAINSAANRNQLQHGRLILPANADDAKRRFERLLRSADNHQAKMNNPGGNKQAPMATSEWNKNNEERANGSASPPSAPADFAGCRANMTERSAKVVKRNAATPPTLPPMTGIE